MIEKAGKQHICKKTKSSCIKNFFDCIQLQKLSIYIFIYEAYSSVEICFYTILPTKLSIWLMDEHCQGLFCCNVQMKHTTKAFFDIIGFLVICCEPQNLLSLLRKGVYITLLFYVVSVL